MTAISKMSYQNAGFLAKDSVPQIANEGRIKVGADAGIMIFDSKTVRVPERRRAHEKLLRPARLWRKPGVLKKRKKTTGLPILLRSSVEAVLTDSEPLVSGASTRSAVELINDHSLICGQNKAR